MAVEVLLAGRSGVGVVMDAGPFDTRTPAWRGRIVQGDDEIVLGRKQALDGGQDRGGAVVVIASGSGDVAVGLFVLVGDAGSSKPGGNGASSSCEEDAEQQAWEAACDVGMQSKAEGEKK